MLGLYVDPSEESIEAEDEDGGSYSHDKSKFYVLRVMISSLRNGGVVGPALFVLDDTHVVGVEGSEYDNRQVD